MSVVPARRSTTPLPAGPPASAGPRGLVDRWWFAICALTLLVTTEYKWRIRSHEEALGGSPDLQILVELAAYAVVAFYLLERRTPVPRGRVTHPALWFLAVYSFYAALSASWSPYVATAAVRGAECLVVLLLVWTLAQVGDRAQVHRFLHGFIVLTAASVVLAIVWPMPAPWTDRGRLSWLQVPPTTSSIFMGVAIVLAVVYLAMRRADTAGVRWPRLVLVGCLGILLYGLLANHSRGSVAAAIVGLVVAAALVRPLALRAAVLLAVAVVGACGVTTFWDTLVAYTARGEAPDQLASLNGRYGFWEVAFQSVRDNPLFGSGLYASRGIFYDETGLGGGHNAFINVLVDLGGVGLLLLVLVLLSLGWAAWRLPPLQRDVRVDRTIIVCLISFLVVNGATAAGIGGVGNVSFILLSVLVGWTALLPQTRRRPTTYGAPTSHPPLVSR